MTKLEDEDDLQRVLFCLEGRRQREEGDKTMTAKQLLDGS